MKSPVVTSQQTLQFGLYAWPGVHSSAFSPAIALTLVLAPRGKLQHRAPWTNLFPLSSYRGNKLGKRDKDEKQ